MAEFCLDCWKKMNRNVDADTKYIVSKELDLCEGCGEWKHVVIMERKSYYMYIIRRVLLPFQIIYRVIMLPYYLLKSLKKK